MLAHLHADLPGATSLRRSMVLQIWERIGDQIIPIELQSDTGDSQYNITYHQNENPIVTHKIKTTCEIGGVRKCASCSAQLRDTMVRCVNCGGITINVKPDGTAHLQSLYGAERLLSWIMLEATNYGSQIKL
eukprot:1582488-Karenia_brevis.AAC.1